MSDQFLSIFQIILGILLIVLVLLQVKDTGLGTAFGGGMTFYSTKRGVEKILFYLTVIIAALFLIISTVRFIL